MSKFKPAFVFSISMVCLVCFHFLGFLSMIFTFGSSGFYFWFKWFINIWIVCVSKPNILVDITSVPKLLVS